ncbi:M56 family metallopeptidase [Chitinophaga varians]|uniref:M56 family metallopeptidase n=1 Tax=Chitinophaga varians TaxID=2202339 RepID=UPI00165F79FB|nr:M56 family metallopeptidase [Chitinophaga varians]MBC9912161.1 M56 family metallopeptidase [Chitinophaga varians]
MTALIYLEKVVLCSALLYGYYHLALRNNRFHQWNRYYLMLITLVSLVTPLLRIPLPNNNEKTAAVLTYTSKILTLREPAAAIPTTDPIVYLRIALTVIYAIVVAFLLCRLLAGIFGIRRLIRRSTVQEIPPFRFARHPQVKAPFSFFRYIFWDMDSSLDTPDNKQVLQHELVHLREKHSIDKMLLEVITAVCWINPFFYLIKRELSLVHEFIADQKAAGNEVKGYAENILRNAFNSRQFSITNDFFHPPIKRRIFMLTQFRQPRFSYLRRILVLPLGAAIFCSLAFVVDQRPSAIRALVPSGSILNQSVQPEAPTPVTQATPMPGDTIRPKTGIIDSTVSVMRVDPADLTAFPSYPGGDQALALYLSRNTRYPKVAFEKGIQGTVKVHFIIDAHGNITHAEAINTPLGARLEEEAIRVVKAMPSWKPAEKDGRKVAVDYMIPIQFKLEKNLGMIVVGDANSTKEVTQNTLSGADEVFTFVENPPTFEGGEEALSRYLARNIRYPREAQEKGTSGTIFVQFVVDKEGYIKDTRTVGAAKGNGLEDEAIRVVSAMPRWHAGKQNGRDVNVQFNLPIRFTLQE